MQYRSEIDGLRAVAVVPVILFHAGFDFFSGGYVGVDVFFVISGFLITSILISEFRNETFSIAKFYERRARRILPALFFVIISCLPFSYLWLGSTQLEDFAKSIVATVLAISNLYFLSQVDYFGSNSESEILLHTWSLAIEEQYYVLFPLLLYMTKKLKESTTNQIILVLVLLSLTFSEWGLRENAARNYFFSFSRFWEIGVGSACAIWAKEKKQSENNIISAIGFTLILFAIFFFDKETPFPGIYAAIPVFGTALVLLFANRNTYVGRLLSLRAIVGIGLISYSAYLWHQPLFAFARIRSLNEPSQWLMALLSVFSLLLAWATWHWIEKPFRRNSYPLLSSRNSVFMSSLAIATLIITVGLAGIIGQGFAWRFESNIQHIIQAVDDRADDKCFFQTRDALPVHPVSRCLNVTAGGNIDVMLLGDSHSLSISAELGKALKQENINFYDISYSGCVPFVGFKQGHETSPYLCRDFNTAAFDYASKSKIKTVVLTSRYPLYLHGSQFDNGEGGVETGIPGWIDLAGREDIVRDDPARKDRVLAEYEVQIRSLAKVFNVVLVYPVPEAGWDVPSRAFKNTYFNDSREGISTPYSAYKERTHEIVALFDRLVSEIPNVYGARVQNVLCSSETNRCLNSDENKVYYYDDDHLSNEGARLVTPVVLEAIKASIQ